MSYLLLRGAGEMLGTRQNGLAQFRNVDPEQHFGLLELAHSAAAHLLSKDSQLKNTKEGQRAQQLLQLYGQDNDISSLK